MISTAQCWLYSYVFVAMPRWSLLIDVGTLFFFKKRTAQRMMSLKETATTMSMMTRTRTTTTTIQCVRIIPCEIRSILYWWISSISCVKFHHIIKCITIKGNKQNGKTWYILFRRQKSKFYDFTVHTHTHANTSSSVANTIFSVNKAIRHFIA